MKKIMIMALLVLCTGTLYGQKGTISATLLDISNEDPIAGAVVALRSVSDTTQVKYYTSVYQGVVTIADVDYGEYTATFSFLGYGDETKKVKVDNPTVNLGKIYLSESATMIDAVVAQGQAIRTSQKGDTVVYNADAFKVTRDADAEALLSKMPGITVIDGEVEAQGETVGKVFVDGKEFFGQDVSTTIKALPAEMVSKVEVYNKLSDMAEFSGVDDGEGFKAINIVTHTDKRTAQFGKMYGAWGIKDKYDVGANLNIFGDHRFSVIGMANNLNKQNFSVEDILGAVSGGSGSGGMSSRGGGNMRFMGGNARNFMVRQQDGVSAVQSFGLNYTGTWAKKLEVEGSYFFNNSRNKYWSDTDRNYTNQYGWQDEISNTSKTRNQEHRFNAKFEYKINENHHLMMRPSFSIQNYRNDYLTETEREAPDDVTGLYSPYYQHELSSLSKNTGYNIGNTLVYRVRIGKPGRTLVTEIGGRYSRNDREGLSVNDTYYYGTGITEFVKDTTITNNRSYTLNGNVMYTEPVTEHSQITAQYRANYNYSDIDRKRYNWETGPGAWDLTTYDPDYSNIYNSGYLTQRVGPGYNYRKDRTSFNASVEYQRATLQNEQEYPVPADLKYNFNNVVYFSRMEHAFNSQNTLRIFAHSYTSNPSVTQLQDVVDISNIQSVTAGNPDLQPSYTHRVMANFNRSNIEKGSTFMVMGHFSAETDYIGESIRVSEGDIPLPDGSLLQAGAQYRTYRNMSGNWNAMLGVNYGFPVKAIKSNININLNGMIRETPSVLDGVKNKLLGQYYNAGIVIGSNISENLDFTIQYNGGYNLAKNSITDNNEYLVHYASLRFKWVMWADFTFSGNGSFTQNKGITEDYNDKTYLLNLALGKKIFRNKRGEITLGINDVFNQKTSFRRTVTTNYIENVKYNTLGRYYAIQFVYNLRNYKGSGSTSGETPDSLRGPGGRPMGPPPGGGPPRF